MRVCHITPHLPPDQAANALLPAHLGAWAAAAGDAVSYLAHPPRAGRPAPAAGPVVWVPARHDAGGRLARLKPLDSLVRALRLWRLARPLIAAADVVHVHGNGLLAEVGGLLARRLGKPVVLTLYGTEIWHYRPKRGVDLFTRLYRGAAAVTFYSRGLLDRARELGLDRPDLSVVYPPVADAFCWHSTEAQRALREELGLEPGPLLVNVKRVHPLAGQRYLIEALPPVVARHPGVRLVVCGTGPLLGELTDFARRLAIDRHVTLAGLVDNREVARYVAAADVFVLPSLLEAMPTVAVEALAAGTPVVSADHPGGIELSHLFADDVDLVPRERADLLADALLARLEAPRRTSCATRDGIEREFRPPVVWSRFRAVYEQAFAGHVRSLS